MDATRNGSSEAQRVSKQREASQAATRGDGSSGVSRGRREKAGRKMAEDGRKRGARRSPLETVGHEGGRVSLAGGAAGGARRRLVHGRVRVPLDVSFMELRLRLHTDGVSE